MVFKAAQQHFWMNQNKLICRCQYIVQYKPEFPPKVIDETVYDFWVNFIVFLHLTILTKVSVYLFPTKVFL